MTQGRKTDHGMIAVLTREGFKAKEIAERLDVSMRTVYRARKLTHTAKPSCRRFTPEEIEIVEAMFADGCSYHEIGRTLGRFDATIRQKWPGRGWTHEQIFEWQSFYARNRKAMP